MRITQRAVTLTSLQGLNSNLAALSKMQQQLTSGKTISLPSDDPTGTNTSMIPRQGIAGVPQQARNISDGSTFLDATDSSLQDMLDQAQRVRDLTVQALNTGSQDTNSNQAIAAEVTGVRQSMLGQANQVVQNRPLFGGVTSGSKADGDTGDHLGVGAATSRPKPPDAPSPSVGGGGANGTPVKPLPRRVSDVENIRVDITGPEA